jgi:filamentous hemagglutinin
MRTPGYSAAPVGSIVVPGQENKGPIDGLTTISPMPEVQGPTLIFNNSLNNSQLPNGQTVEEFEKSLVGLQSGERVAKIKEIAAQVSASLGMVKDNKLTRMNGRNVYKGTDGYLYALDTMHGSFEKINPKTGVHLGEVDFTMRKITKADTSGGHDLRVN